MLSRALVALLLLATTLPAFAKERPVYQDGVLVSFKLTQVGHFCSTSGDTTGRVNANTDSTGSTYGTVNATTSSTTTCHASQAGYYTVTIGVQTFVLYPAPSLAKAGGVFLTMGLAAAFYRNSVLYGQLPGTPLKIRSDGNGDFYVKVGKRESEYKLASAY